MPSQNTTTVQCADGRSILLSYGVPVAAWIPRSFTACTCRPGQQSLLDPGDECPQHGPRQLPDVSGPVYTERRYSVTTSRHVTQFLPDGRDGATEIGEAVWPKLVAPLAIPR